MNRYIWSVGLLLAVAPFGNLGTAAAQGVTTAAVTGRISDESGAPVALAEVLLINASTGERHSVRARDDGTYSFEHTSVGGPYSLTARALGFEPKTSTAFSVALGQRFVLDLALKRAAVQVSGITVSAESDPLTSPSRTGASTFLSDRAIHRLPTLNRSFTDFMSTAPQIVGRSVAGQNDRFNNIQIDGGAKYDQEQYGFSIGGPIIQDRLHFFASGDFRHDARPFASSVQLGSSGDTTGVGITAARFDSVRNILKTTYGFDPGGFDAPTIPNPETNLFGKLSYELGTNSHVEVSGTYVNADRVVLGHSYRTNYTSSSSNLRDGYILSNSGYDFTDHTRTVRGKWTALIANRYSNEMILGYSTISDVRALPNRVPLILVSGNSTGSYVAAGAERFSQANTLDQRVIEFTDNVTFTRGQHQLTVGTHNEFFHFRNVFFPASIGIWNFASPDSLRLGLPNQFFRALPTTQRPDGPIADFNVKQFGFYAEDRFSPAHNLTLTTGLRIDIPYQPSPTFNPTLDTIAFPALGGKGVNTGSFPTGNILWSPRLGFNYDVTGDRQTVVRGGVGIFSGRPPYVWLSNAYGNTGQEQQTIYCNTGAIVPVFTMDPNNQPTSCLSGAPSAGRPSVVYFDSDFKFPQALKVAIGADQQLGWGVLGTIDFLYTKSINQFFLQDVNLVGLQGSSAGESGRPLYGTIPAVIATATPVVTARVTGTYADVIRNSNRSGDRSTSLTVQVQKRFGEGIEFSASYTYTHVLDLRSFTSDITSSNYVFGVLDGTVTSPNLRTSSFDRPHKVTLSGTVDAPLDTRFSLTYNGLSGTPFTYVVNGDINADGFSGNDAVYVPRSASDISGLSAAQYATLDAYINGEPCLRNNRGRILPRNSCRNPWQNFL